jgi:asparagine synthase (glutamine-hydrolysing)
VCGIYGYVGPESALASPEALESAIQALWHRGPDDRGRYRDDAGATICGLAHTRLSIIDLSPAGHQPRTTSDGRYTIVYNGEVFNHVEIRQELAALGVGFDSSCDTEVVLKAFVRWGAECLSRFRGMFAFAIWDARERALFLARDRLGIKPLYYVERPGGGLAFASEVRALLATGAADRRLSRAALGSYFAFGAVSGPGTILEGVHSVPAGHTLELRDGHAALRRYWEIPLERAPQSTFEDEVRELGPILKEAVRLRLIADVPVGVFLSGGIDSSALVALATEPGAAPIHTFTVTFDEESYSEAPFAAEIARRYGCMHKQVHLPGARAALEIDAAVGALDQPSSDGVNTYFVSKAAREAGLAVALSGLGGDELFAGYTYFRAFARALPVARALEAFPSPLRAALQRAGRSPMAPTQVRKLLALLASSGRPGTAYAVLRAMFTLDQRERLLTDELGAGAAYDGVTLPAQLHERLASGEVDAINAFSALELTNYLKNTLLRDSDAMSMAHSLEVRVPLLDHLLVEKVLRVRGALKLSDTANKPMLVAAVPGLPRDVSMRPKMGFTLPFDAWFRGPLRGWMEEMLLSSATQQLGLFRPGAVERLWRSFLRSERYTSHSRIWCIAALVGWCRTNRVTL